MKFHNLRMGKATNSSSTHSIVCLPKGYDFPFHDEEDGDGYGWENFCLKKPESKMRYIAAQMSVGSFPAKVIKNLTGISKHEVEDLSIDHQSIWEWLYEEPKLAFLKDMVTYIRDNPRVVILGGNDNGGYPDEHFELPPNAEDLRWVKDSSNKIRKDGDYYAIFNAKSGDKVRLSLNDDAPDYTKSTYPELCDIKVTSFCESKCVFCYQSSTPNGKHASKSDIFDAIDLLAEMRVFEIAIGGGEPTTHPDFANILAYATEKDIQPNFSTYSVEWLNNAELVNQIKKSSCGVGFSVHNLEDLARAKQVAIKLNGPGYSYGNKVSTNWKAKCQVMCQLVLGALDIVVTQDIIATCITDNIPLLLLGYKSVGFGKGKQQIPYTDYQILTDMLKLKLLGLDKRDTYNSRLEFSLSVDTAIVDNFKELLTFLNVQDILVTSPEGKFSCYIDAVAHKMGASSYVPKSKMVAMPDNVADFATVYANY